MKKNEIFKTLNEVTFDDLVKVLTTKEAETEWKELGERLNREEAIAWAAARNTLLH